MKHDLKRKLETGKLHCSVCHWSWKTPPVMECPGVPRYDRDERPQHLLTKTELRARKLKPGPARGVFYRSAQAGKPTKWCFLYDPAEAIPTRPLEGSK